jgi:hypothetical protein
VERRRWLNQGQPQTLIIACFLLYVRAAEALLFGLSASALSLVPLLVVLAGVFAGYGIANERRWGYYLGIAVALLPFAVAAMLTRNHNPLGVGDPLALLFDIALVALLLHTQSREYQKVWFK